LLIVVAGLCASLKAQATNACPEDPKILARQLLEMDLSGMRLPEWSKCLDATAFPDVNVHQDPVMDSSLPAPEVIPSSARIEITRVEATDSMGGAVAHYVIDVGKGRKPLYGTLPIVIHKSELRQRRSGCAQLLGFPSPWRIRENCRASR